METTRALSITLGQPLADPGNLATSVANHVVIVRATHSDLVVFPEMSLTGYFMDAPVIDFEGEEFAPLQQACAELDTAVLVSAPIHQGNKDYIGVVRIDAEGHSVVAAKTCLVDHEKPRFHAGSGPYTIDVKGFTVGLSVCMDNWTDDFIRQLVTLDVDLLCASSFDFAGEEEEFHNHFKDLARKLDCPIAVARLVGDTQLADAASGCSAFYIPDLEHTTAGDKQPVEVIAASADAGDVITHTFS